VAQIRSDYEDDEDVMKYIGSMDMVTETAFRVVTGPRSLDAETSSREEFIGDDRMHKNAVTTYAENLSREEFNMRQQVNRGYDLNWMSGKEICANLMTKAVYQDEHRRHVHDVLGHGLLKEFGEEEENTSLTEIVLEEGTVADIKAV
jgi:hypothetical protein